MTLTTRQLLLALASGMVLSAGIAVNAGELNPLAFAPIGPFPTAAGTYQVDTATSLSAPTIIGPGGTSISGVFYQGIAVFDFSSISVNSNQVFDGSGTDPIAFLSRSNINVSGTINVSAGLPGTDPTYGGPGGFNAASGPGAGGPGVTTGYPFFPISFGAPGGGGFGGLGGSGASSTETAGGVFVNSPNGGGSGGSTYGNLAVSLQGGSGGGSTLGQVVALGGGGGGALELGAVGAVTISGSIQADGSTNQVNDGSGGGSGGGIFLHGDSVALSGVLSAQGGAGVFGGGGGGGGEVLIETGPGGFTGSLSGINVSGGSGGPNPGFSTGEPGSAGIITLISVPEPASFLLLGVGVLGVLGWMRWRLRGRATALELAGL